MGLKCPVGVEDGDDRYIWKKQQRQLGRLRLQGWKPLIKTAPPTPHIQQKPLKRGYSLVKP